MTKIIFGMALVLMMASPLAAGNGMIDVQSTLNVEDTANRLETVLKKKGMTVFKRIKHSDSAAKVGVELRDTQVIIFGNPKVGSPLMKCQQSVAIDLPQKMMVWADDKGKVWISYNDPKYLKKRHRIKGCDPLLAKISNALASIAKAASKK